MGTVYLRGYAQRAESESGPIRFVIATEGKKADGLDLKMDRLDLDRYNANPVIMYGHSYFGRENLPIGRAENVSVEGDKLVGDAVFDMDDPFAATVDRKYRAGVMNAVSVGFDFRGLDVETGIPDSWEMLEFSAVPIPLDPDAVSDIGRQVALARAIADTRDGKKLSAASRKLVTQAIEALTALVADSGDEADDAGDEPRALSAAAARLGVEQMQRDLALV